jgi:hypothetical protein
MTGPVTSPSILTNRLLDLILIVTRKLRSNLPLTISRLNDLIHYILLRIFICAAQVLHQLLDGCSRWNKELDVLGVVLFEHGCLPGLLFGLEDVYLAVLLGECVVVSGREADTTGVVSEVDTREAMVSERRNSRICHSTRAETSQWWHKHWLLGKAWVL